MSDNEPSTSSPKVRRRAHHRGGFWLVLSLAVFLSGAAVVVFAFVGQTVTAPDWVRNQISKRISAELPDMRISFGDLTLSLTPEEFGQVRLVNVDVATANGDPIVELTDLTFGLAPEALMRGRISLQRVSLSGAFVTLRRDVQGRLGLSFGDVIPSEGTLPDIPSLIRAFDAALAHRRLADLDLVAVNAMTVRYEDARARQAWTVDGGRMELTRNKTTVSLRGDFAVLTGGSDVATLELSAQSDIGKADASFGFTLQNMPSQDIGAQSPALAWLEALRAPISGALRAQMFADGTLGPLSATLQIGQGVLQPNNETRPLPFQGARTYFTYDSAAQTLSFDDIQVDSPWGRATADGKAVMVGMESGLPTEMVGQFNLSGLEVKADGFLETPVSLSRAEMDFRLRLDPFQFTLGRMYIDDDLLEARISGDLKAMRDGWAASIDAGLEHATPSSILAFWPLSLEPKARDWVATRVLGGRFADAVVAMRANPDERPVVYLDTGIEDAIVKFSRNMPPLQSGAGRLTIHDNRLVVMVEEGAIDPGAGGLLDVAGSAVILPDITIKKGPAQVQVKGRGALADALTLLDLPPLSLMSKAGLSPDMASGDVVARGNLDFQMVKGLQPKDIGFDFTATAQDVRSDQLIKGRTLTADALQITANRQEVTVSGAAQMDGVPVTGTWRQPTDTPGQPSQLDAEVPISQTTLAGLNIRLPDGLVQGQGRGRLTATIAKGAAPEFALRSDLAGLGMSIPSIGWALGRSQTGSFEVTGRLSTPPVIDRIALEGGGLSASGTVALAANGALDRLRLDRVRVGGWLDAPVDLVGRGVGAAPAVVVRGGTVDLRRAKFASSGGGGSAASASGPIQLALDKLQVSDGLALNGFRGEFTTRGGLSGKFTGKVNGGTALSGAVIPQAKGSAFRLQSTDAGGVLRSAGFFKTAYNGVLDLTLVPTGAEGTYNGTLKIGKVSLRDAPAIGSLLDAISIVGLIDQLNGPGIEFTEVEAQFQLNPNQLILTQSSAIGPSMGVSLDGYYNLASRQFDMQGVLSPIYMINAVGQVFARKGEGLFGFNFNIKGSADAPKVSVNPLSVLTPGLFREIFRRPPPKLTQ
ncbi:YhdP family protein [Pseudoprimorskyibacter insulae]|uniref:YhdP central domain-containing protein n=1 Tax=Pseudoprimorskyibacter insulae TaxID=1695997 RepID=A0A2R8AWJ6_9RHOB|nr:DUF3971 domain-containing protein [Pseudoprimorskyibacter insulae]SPF80400.1 hypothetical protein PRI8871_02206 [Pseudoprimorskyibacter insulae]